MDSYLIFSERYYQCVSLLPLFLSLLLVYFYTLFSTSFTLSLSYPLYHQTFLSRPLYSSLVFNFSLSLSLSLSLHSSKVTSVIPVDSYAREDEHLVLMTSQGNKNDLQLPFIYDRYILDKCCFNRFSVSSPISFFLTSHFYLFIY